MELLFKSKLIQYYKLEEGILFSRHLTSTLTIDELTSIILKRKELSAFHELKHMIVDHSMISKLPHEARIKIREESAYEGLSSLAFVGNNAIATLGFNILIKIKPSRIPMRGFKTLDSAIQWSLEHHESLVYQR